MPNKIIDLYWDLGSTNTYFAIKLIQPITARHGAEIRWHPFNLGYVFKSNTNREFRNPPKTSEKR